MLSEIQEGDVDAAARRLALVEAIPVLAFTDDVLILVEAYDQRLGPIGRARADQPST